MLIDFVLSATSVCVLDEHVDPQIDRVYTTTLSWCMFSSRAHLRYSECKNEMVAAELHFSTYQTYLHARVKILKNYSFVYLHK